MSNSIVIVGNLTSDPELRFTQTGVAYVSGSIASNRKYQVNGQWEEKTSYFNFSAWRELAENIAASCTKGMRVVITGRIEQKSWTDKEGNERKTHELAVDDIGPSLRWAHASVTKVAKSGSDGNANVSNATAAFNATPAFEEEDPF
jgi:single-strand DNA-binding protein